MITNLEIANVAFKHLVDNFTTFAIELPNIEFDPAVDGPGGWVRSNMLGVSAERELITGSLSGEGLKPEGIFSVQVFAPIKTGYGGGLGVADEIGELFREKRLPLASGLNLIFNVPETFDVGETKTWYQVNLQVPYHYHT